MELSHVCHLHSIEINRERREKEGMLTAQATTVLSPVAKSSVQRLVRDLVRLGASRHPHNDVSIGRNAGSLRRSCDGSRGFWGWCGAAVRVCQTFLVSFLKSLMTAGLLVVDSLLVNGPSSGK